MWGNLFNWYSAFSCLSVLHILLWPRCFVSPRHLFFLLLTPARPLCLGGEGADLFIEHLSDWHSLIVSIDCQGAAFIFADLVLKSVFILTLTLDIALMVGMGRGWESVLRACRPSSWNTVCQEKNEYVEHVSKHDDQHFYVAPPSYAYWEIFDY